MKKIDCTGLQCPTPVTKVKKYFDSIGEGEAIVLLDNEIANGNVTRYAMNHGYHVESMEKGSVYEVIIEKRGCLEILEENKETSILISSDKFGDGNDKVGDTLMMKYIDVISEEDQLPNSLIFVNSGVKLVSEGSKVIEGIRLLEEKGVKIYCSETCLKDYKLDDKLLIGKRVDMTKIVDIMNKAENFIRL
ncbi:sulfurtransferase-like selenium metabolism protein YedF [Clostridium sp. SHJSY1]|uniref:sulfurtransferase-like selenium metabolism protein YedF n=1 Tax=Clostridium sp. SHJSY1 TaxID=2942483 RepID=UPI002876C1D8|nr:sulfurtransferase-like selenium metabolism protein YedF [Clostridium sp. SHJSY1]MDS0528106.1 sulfurtransferase-like selenium metabolism protein YedF [Clostridium sp. SHJSY1]